MPNFYKVIYFPIAIDDVNNILNYISIDNPPVALELINKIDYAISSLSQFPYKGVSPKDYHLKSKNYRMLIIDSYIVFYIVNDTLSIIEIMRVLSSKQNYLSLL
jgi:toxin ParE1/3/4